MFTSRETSETTFSKQKFGHKRKKGRRETEREKREGGREEEGGMEGRRNSHIHLEVIHPCADPPDLCLAGSCTDEAW